MIVLINILSVVPQWMSRPNPWILAGFTVISMSLTYRSDIILPMHFNCEVPATRLFKICCLRSAYYTSQLTLSRSATDRKLYGQESPRDSGYYIWSIHCYAVFWVSIKGLTKREKVKGAPICWPGNHGVGGTKPVLYAYSVHTARAKTRAKWMKGVCSTGRGSICPGRVFVTVRASA